MANPAATVKGWPGEGAAADHDLFPLVSLSLGRRFFHDLFFPDDGAHRQSPSHDLPQGGQIRNDSKPSGLLPGRVETLR